MSEPEYTDKVANARKKLKQFQARRMNHNYREDDNSMKPQASPSLSVSSRSDEVNGRDSVSSNFREESATPSIQPSHTPSIDQSFELRTALRNAENEITRLNTVYQELISHYSSLHEAYVKLQEAPPVSKTTETQILKLQAALSSVVEEKTTLQNALRVKEQTVESLTAEVEKLNSQSNNQEAQNVPPPNDGHSAASEAQIRRLEAEVDKHLETISRLHKQNSRHQVDTTNLELKLQRMQQDQNEAQARLRTAYREIEEKSEVVKSLKQKNEMLEIHVGQIQEHGLGSAQGTNLLDENQKLQQRVAALTAENTEWKKQVDSQQIYYDTYKKDLDEHVNAITVELDNTRRSLHEKSDELAYAQDRITELIKELNTVRAQNAEENNSADSVAMNNKIHEEEMRSLRRYAEELHDKYTKICEQQQETIAEGLEMKQAYESMKLSFEASQFELEEERHSHRRLKESMETTQQINTDVRSLAEQLTNEKATVSRAVTQNNELKEQLIEMEDKLIKVMNESAEREQNLQSALFTVSQLRAELESAQSAGGANENANDDVSQAEGDGHSTVLSSVEANYTGAALNDTIDTSFIGTATDTEAVNSVISPDSSIAGPGGPPSAYTYSTSAATGLMDSSFVTDSAVSGNLQETEEGVLLEGTGTLAEIETESDDEHLHDEQHDDHVDLQGESSNYASSSDSNSGFSIIPDPELLALRDQLRATTDELQTVRAELRRMTAENEEFHRIMEQNAEDENQNNIHVELGHAMNRISDLNAENQQLRLELSTSSEDQTTVEKEAQTDMAQEVIGSSDWTIRELENRLRRALNAQAHLTEQNDMMEHKLIALETETDAIGDFVTIYHHQRKVINSRLTERDAQIAQLTKEKFVIQEKLAELQNAVYVMLTKHGLLNEYHCVDHQIEKKQRTTKRARKTRTYSQTVTDELSGEEEIVVDSEDVVLPEEPGQPDALNATPSQLPSDSANSPDPSAQDGLNGNATISEDVNITRVLQLITDLKSPGVPAQPFDINLHCKDCKGKLQTL